MTAHVVTAPRPLLAHKQEKLAAEKEAEKAREEEKRAAERAEEEAIAQAKREESARARSRWAAAGSASGVPAQPTAAAAPGLADVVVEAATASGYLPSFGDGPRTGRRASVRATPLQPAAVTSTSPSRRMPRASAPPIYQSPPAPVPTATTTALPAAATAFPTAAPMVGAAASLPPMMMTVPESAAPSAAATPTAGTTPTASAAATSAEVEALRATLALKEEQLEAAQQRLRAAQTEAADLHEQSNRSRGFLEEERRLHGEERGRCQALEAALTAARSEGAALRETVAGASAVHAQEMESLKRLHEAGAQQLAEHAAADRVNVQAMAHEERNRALEAMAQVHQKELEARQAEWRAEVEMLSRHYTTADTLTELTARVQHGSSFLDELQERVVGEREKAARDRQQRLIQQEKNLESREAALATREREVVHMRAQVRNENTHRRPSRSLRLSSLIVLALGKRGVRRVV